MHRGFLITASSLLAVAVILGAFGAHGLKNILAPEAIGTFETGVRYHFYHAFALLAVAIVYGSFRNKWIKYSGYAFILGIILFSGSLFLLTAIKATNTVGLSGIGIITPIGGLCFVAGWFMFIFGVAARNDTSLKSI